MAARWDPIAHTTGADNASRDQNCEWWLQYRHVFDQESSSNQATYALDEDLVHDVQYNSPVPVASRIGALAPIVPIPLPVTA